jgi:serine/alanine adding enzyme
MIGGNYMYKFSNDVSIKEYELFLKKYSGVPITQDYRWAKVKDNWDNTICGLYKDDELIAATLLLIKVLPLGIKMIYSPRGYLIDYTNKKYLEEFTKGIKEYAKKIKAFMIKIDPLIAVNEECLDGKKEYPINFSVDYKEKINDLLENKYIHKGYEKTMNAYIQPRFNMMVPLIDKENKSLSKEEVLKSLKGKNKNQVGDYHIKRGCIFTSSSDMKDIDSFYE